MAGPVKTAKGLSMSVKLTDGEDRCIAAPPSLKGAAAQKIAAKLVDVPRRSRN